MTPGIHEAVVIGNPLAEPVPGGWLIREPFVVFHRDGEWTPVPAETFTDFASIPRVLWPVFPPWDDRYVAQAVAHDQNYATHAVEKVRADYYLWEGVRGSRLLRTALWLATRYWPWSWSFYETGPARQHARLAHLRALGLS